MQSYSPFSKAFRDLQPADLQRLKQASEGWYIEYKREVPNASALAKALSAFANTYGGWLFLGVQEESKESPVAGSFPGISKDEVDPALQRMRKSAADSLNPTPHFDTCVLWGPDASIDLAQDRAVICAWIPQSVTAPHIHKSGHIYRRVADSSEPRPENDRFVLDQLWRRADAIKRHHKEWYDQDPEFSEREEELPYVRLMLVADRWAERDVWLEESEDEVRALLSEPSGVSVIPFDTVHTSSDGFIARQLKGNDPQNLTLTWRLRRDLTSDVIIPLPLYQRDRPENLSIDLNGYEYAENFMGVLGKYTTSILRVVDLNYLFNILTGVAGIQDRLCELAGWKESYFLKVKVLNAWRNMPFIDVQEIIQRFDKFGPPMCLDSVAHLPRGTGPENYVEISRHSDMDNETARMLVQSLLMFHPLAVLFGVPSWIPHDDNDTVTPYHKALQAAGRRAIEVQRRRKSRTTR
ncbi:helix-turn-helix domain-containing protein [Halomonas denitrificans]|uniref:AlbA family DNA-binding domain-containing protein n=1 Tax=Halomonas denitrificans TaxID=370769 RepID=UPI001C9A266C|nr:ATP-binding protein [Halomonas denitrificans]MBY5970577.1 ATP-binding protein [Halomonas denitrificans]